ncbi:zinc ribbon domain-containing protein [Paenibacillus sp. FSL W7-1279]|uniref:zinc ribbon domain-containing protein n=1 Tax=Paenibacillus sp. FSL W7-1279 TaxID=2921697 RepID=UPI0030DA6535
MRFIPLWSCTISFHLSDVFVSCTRCGFVEVFNPDVLRGHKSGVLGMVLDIIWR